MSKENKEILSATIEPSIKLRIKKIGKQTDLSDSYIVNQALKAGLPSVEKKFGIKTKLQ